MKIILDNHEYQVDLTKPIEFFRLVYLKINNEGIQTKSGEIIKLGDRSLLRTTVKTIMTPLIIPWLRKMYKDRDIILDPPIPHSDLIDYSVNAFFDYISIVEKRLNVHLASKTINDSRSTIESISPSWEEPLAIEQSTFKEGSENE